MKKERQKTNGGEERAPNECPPAAYVRESAAISPNTDTSKTQLAGEGEEEKTALQKKGADKGQLCCRRQFLRSLERGFLRTQVNDMNALRRWKDRHGTRRLRGENSGKRTDREKKKNQTKNHTSHGGPPHPHHTRRERESIS